MEKNLQKKIVVDKGVRKQIGTNVGCTQYTVRKALAGIVQTAMHVKIRELAIELGGREIE